MKPVIPAILFVSFWSVSPAVAQEIDCKGWRNSTQTTMNICSFKEFERADRLMTAAWKQAKVVAQERDRDLSPVDRGVWKALLKSQRGWVAYKEGQCLATRYKVHGGSMAPLVANLCFTGLTQSRTEELRRFVDDRP